MDIIKKLTLITATLLAFSAQSQTLEFRTEVGKQEDTTTLDVGFESRIYLKEYNDGLFLLGGVGYKMIDLDEKILVNKPKIYKNEDISRRDITVDFGLGYDFGRFDFIGYLGLGNSKKEHDKGTYERDCKTCDSDLVDLETTKEEQVKKEAGIRVGYEFGDRDINPFIDVSKIKYDDSPSQSSMTFGITFGF